MKHLILRRAGNTKRRYDPAAAGGGTNAPERVRPFVLPLIAILAGVGLVLAPGGLARADLLMHWDFDNVTGDKVTNTGTLGASADGTLRGGVTVVSDPTFGSVAQYDNSGGTFTYMGASGVGIQVGKVATVAAFYKGTDFDYWMDQRSPRSALIAGWSGSVQVYDGAWSSTGYAANNIEDGAWHHIAVAVNGSGATSNGLAAGSAKLLVDGVPVGTASSLAGWDLKTGSTTLWGAHNMGSSSQTSGLHDDVRIYNEILGDSAIASLAAALPPPPPGLLVDLDGQSGPTQSGYSSWDPAGTGTIGTLNESRSFAASLSTDGTVDVTMTTAGNTYERNYDAVTGPVSGQNNLLKDLVFFNQRLDGDNYYQVQFDDLKAGDYRFTAYHVATNALTGDATVDILLNGADTGMDVTLLDTSSPAAARSSIVDFTVANDNDPITIRYANPTQNHFGLNGFELEAAPAHVALVGVNIDDDNTSLREGRPTRFTLPEDYVNYELNGGVLDVPTSFATDGTMGVEVDSPYFRNTIDSNYGDVTVLDGSGDPVKGFNTVMNSGALVNNTTGQTIELTLTDLADGDYEIKFWLHSVFTHSEGASGGLWDISGAASADDVLTSLGYNAPADGNPIPGFADIGTISLPFAVSGGTASFTFTPDTLDGSSQLWLSGFELTQAPEPASALLIFLGLGAVASRLRRRLRVA